MMAQIETEPTFSPRTPQPLFGRPTYTVRGAGRQYDIAPDGDRFLFMFMKPGVSGQTSDDARFTGLIFVENWFQELTERVPIP